MARKFIASILTAAVLVTALNAAPARATDIRDLAGAAAGIAAVAIIANQLNKQRDRGDESYSSRNSLGQIFAPQQRVPQYGQGGQYYGQGNYGQGGQHFVKPRPLPDRVARRALPAACLQTVEDRRGRAFNVLGQRCLENNFRGARNLPQSCAVDIQSNRGWRSAYDANCLSRAGYSIARY
ncbi:MAG: hypothetical protein ACU0A4_10335 [Paracoccaceae bacterium]|jgi:hypothetical protein